MMSGTTPFNWVEAPLTPEELAGKGEESGDPAVLKRKRGGHWVH